MAFVPPNPGAAPDRGTVLEILRYALDQVRELATRDPRSTVYPEVATELDATIAKLETAIDTSSS